MQNRVFLSLLIAAGSAVPALAQDRATANVSAQIADNSVFFSVDASDGRFGIITPPVTSGNICTYVIGPTDQQSGVLGETVSSDLLFAGGSENPEPRTCILDSFAETPTFEIACAAGEPVTVQFSENFQALNTVGASATSLLGLEGAGVPLQPGSSSTVTCPNDRELSTSVIMGMSVTSETIPTESEITIGSMTIDLIF